jgi:hypothetical protein
VHLRFLPFAVGEEAFVSKRGLRRRKHNDAFFSTVNRFSSLIEARGGKSRSMTSSAAQPSQGPARNYRAAAVDHSRMTLEHVFGTLEHCRNALSSRVVSST